MKLSPIRSSPSLKRVSFHGVSRGIRVCRKTWVSGKEYRGVNLLLLSTAGCEYFVTRKQAEGLGGKIRCKGFPVVFWKILERENRKSGEIERIPMLR